MLVETGVLRGHRRRHQIGGELFVGHVGAVLYVERRQDFAVLGYDLGRKLVVGVFKLFERGDLRKESDKRDGEYQYRERRCDDYPEPLDYLLLDCIFHRHLFLPRNTGGQSKTITKLTIKFLNFTEFVIFFAE